jgi:AraC-like DNA-binding protein
MVLTEKLRHVVQDVQVRGRLVSADQFQHVEHLPDGTSGFLFRIMQESRGELSVVGTRTRALYKTVTPVPLAISVRFRAGAASAILGVPADELTNRVVSLEELWGSEARRLHDTLLSTRGLAAIVQLLQRALSGRAVRLDERPSTQLVHAAIRRIEQSATPVCVARVAADLGVTTRHLSRAFTAAVGIGPKEFARVVRFQRAVRFAASERNWARIAVDAGYYDQAHLIRDFQDLAGTTLRAFTKRASIQSLHRRQSPCVWPLESTHSR